MQQKIFLNSKSQELQVNIPHTKSQSLYATNDDNCLALIFQ